MTIYDMYDHLKRTQSAATIKFHLPLARTSFFLPETDNVSTYSSARFALQIGPLAFRRSVFFRETAVDGPLVNQTAYLLAWYHQRVGSFHQVLGSPQRSPTSVPGSVPRALAAVPWRPAPWTPPALARRAPLPARSRPEPWAAASTVAAPPLRPRRRWPPGSDRGSARHWPSAGLASGWKNDETCGSGAKAPFESIWTKQVSCSGRWMKKNSPRVGIDEYMSSSTVDVAFGCFWWGERSSCSTYVSCLLMPSNVVAPSSSCRCLLSQLFCPCMCPTCPNLFALLGGLHGQLSPMFFRRWGFLSQHWNEGMEAKDCAPIPTAYFSTQGISPPEGTSCSLMPKASIRLIPASTRQVAAGCARCAFLQRCEEVPPTSPTTCQVCSIH